MRLVPLTSQVWEVFSSWFNFQPPVPKHGIFITEVVAGQQTLIGGACIYDTDGAYCFVEHFSLNPTTPQGLNHKVAQSVFMSLRADLNVSNKVGVCGVSFKGVEKMLEKVGWVAQPMRMMTYIPGTEPVPSAEPRAEVERNDPPDVLEPADAAKVDAADDDLAQMKAADAASRDDSALDHPDDVDYGDDDIDDLMPTPRKKRSKKAKKKMKRKSLA